MEKILIKVISRETIKPSSPTPSHLQTYKISFLDQFSPPSYIPIILFYPPLTTSDNSSSNTTLFHTFKKSLSETLSRYPLAGRFIKEDNSVHCNDDGVEYVDVDVDTNILQIVENPDMEFLCKLLPRKNDSVSDLASEVQLAVQMNRFQCSGVAVGIQISHKITNGVTFATFLSCWAAMAVNGGSGEAVALYPSYEAAHIMPSKAFSAETKTPSANPEVKVGVFVVPLRQENF